jgi:hypothetical protein
VPACARDSTCLAAPPFPLPFQTDPVPFAPDLRPHAECPSCACGGHAPTPGVWSGYGPSSYVFPGGMEAGGHRPGFGYGAPPPVPPFYPPGMPSMPPGMLYRMWTSAITDAKSRMATSMGMGGGPGMGIGGGIGLFPTGLGPEALLQAQVQAAVNAGMAPTSAQPPLPPAGYAPGARSHGSHGSPSSLSSAYRGAYDVDRDQGPRHVAPPYVPAPGAYSDGPSYHRPPLSACTSPAQCFAHPIHMYSPPAPFRKTPHVLRLLLPSSIHSPPSVCKPLIRRCVCPPPPTHTHTPLTAPTHPHTHSRTLMHGRTHPHVVGTAALRDNAVTEGFSGIGASARAIATAASSWLESGRPGGDAEALCASSRNFATQIQALRKRIATTRGIVEHGHPL